MVFVYRRGRDDDKVPQLGVAGTARRSTWTLDIINRGTHVS